MNEDTVDYLKNQLKELENKQDRAEISLSNLQNKIIEIKKLLQNEKI